MKDDGYVLYRSSAILPREKVAVEHVNVGVASVTFGHCPQPGNVA
jgi:hypothetical protein